MLRSKIRCGEFGLLIGDENLGFILISGSCIVLGSHQFVIDILSDKHLAGIGNINYVIISYL